MSDLVFILGLAGLVVLTILSMTTIEPLVHRFLGDPPVRKKE